MIMKNQFSTVLVAIVGVLSPAFAATVQVDLMPPITGMTGAGHGGSLVDSDIKASDVKSWLSLRNDGWYTTTGNGDMKWGSASVDVDTQTIKLPNMNGTKGVCAGLKLTVDDIQNYSALTFSFDLMPPGAAPEYTYSIWYENSGGDAVQLNLGTRTGSNDMWNLSYEFTSSQLTDIKANADLDGAAKFYVVIGSTKGGNGYAATISNVSLNGEKMEVVPEPAAVSLGLLGLASFLMRRRRA